MPFLDTSRNGDIGNHSAQISLANAWGVPENIMWCAADEPGSGLIYSLDSRGFQSPTNAFSFVAFASGDPS